MSNTDSFIDEVSEEVRRDRLFALMKRYGPFVILAVLALVALAAWVEVSKARELSEAKATGEAILSALEVEDDAERVEALAALDPNPLAALLLANEAKTIDPDQAVAALTALNTDADAPAVYRDIAQFKLVTLQGESMPVEDRLAMMQPLSQPGHVLRLMALEQIAMIHMEAGEAARARAVLTEIAEDAGANGSILDRIALYQALLGPAPTENE